MKYTYRHTRHGTTGITYMITYIVYGTAYVSHTYRMRIPYRVDVNKFNISRKKPYLARRLRLRCALPLRARGRPRSPHARPSLCDIRRSYTRVGVPTVHELQ
jgi:hypothetical protein